MPSYTHAHLLIGGFTQRIGRATNGVHDLFDAVYRRWASPATLVEYYPWYLHPRDIADHLVSLADETRTARRDRLRIQIAAYSFGGQTAAEVCRRLVGHVVVDSLVLCDPIARRGRLGWLAACNPWAKIHLPYNLDRVTWLQQRHSRLTSRWPFFQPAGHEIRAYPHTTVRGPITVDAPHAEIDNSEPFHRHVLDEAERIHEPHWPAIAGSVA